MELTRVVDTVDDGAVDLNKEDSGILDGDFKRLDKGIQENGGSLLVLLVNLALGHELGVASQLSKTLSATEQDVGAASLGEEEQHGNEDRSRGPDGFEEGPAPSLDGDGETAQKRTKGSCKRIMLVMPLYYGLAEGWETYDHSRLQKPRTSWRMGAQEGCTCHQERLHQRPDRASQRNLAGSGGP